MKTSTPRDPAPAIRSDEIDSALAAVRADVLASGNARDAAYFSEHERRFAHSARSLIGLAPRGTTLLDIGSHYLHMAAILSRLGYTVIGLDGPEHVGLRFVSNRAERFGIRNMERGADDLQRGVLLPGWDGQIQGVLFCEIMEHITFNPIMFWRRIHELLPVGGWIYITTPNALKLLSVLGSLWNLVTLKRIGIRTESIFANATYGHHWKEYGARELREYFGRLSPDFDVAVSAVSYGPPSAEVREAIGHAKAVLLAAGNASGFFSENLEAVVTIRGKTPWRTPAPDYA